MPHKPSQEKQPPSPPPPHKQQQQQQQRQPPPPPARPRHCRRAGQWRLTRRASRTTTTGQGSRSGTGLGRSPLQPGQPSPMTTKYRRCKIKRHCSQILFRVPMACDVAHHMPRPIAALPAGRRPTCSTSIARRRSPGARCIRARSWNRVSLPMALPHKRSRPNAHEGGGMRDQAGQRTVVLSPWSST